MDRLDLMDRLAAICGEPDREPFAKGDGRGSDHEFGIVTYWPADMPSLVSCIHAIDEATNNKIVEIRKCVASRPVYRDGWHVVVFCELEEVTR